jgi:biotin transport system substrate-specific component
MQATQRTHTLVDTFIPGQGILRAVLLVVGFSFLVALFAQISIKLPFTTVPITGQTLAVLLAGGALGSKKGASSLGLYALWGTIGIPVYAPSQTAETIHFILPWSGTADPFWLLTSGGYIIGFILAAYIVGYFAERGWDRAWNVTVAMLLGNVAIYLPGLLWLGYLISSGSLDAQLGFKLAEVIPGSSSFEKTLVGGFYPFVVGDLLKLYLASICLPGAWIILGKKRN